MISCHVLLHYLCSCVAIKNGKEGDAKALNIDRALSTILMYCFYFDNYMDFVLENNIKLNYYSELLINIDKKIFQFSLKNLISYSKI